MVAVWQSYSYTDYLNQGHFQQALKTHYDSVQKGMDMDNDVASVVVALDSLDILMTNETLAYGSGTCYKNHLFCLR